jgi:glycosyltransferase involved in cell wall biosynthesis
MLKVIDMINKLFSQETIFVQIASYRDPQLLPTIKDCIEKAKYPENLRFGIAWQHSLDDVWDNLEEYKNDSRFRIVDINYKDSKGACWARNQLQQKYNNEKYTLQLDSHHRFIQDWDSELISMVKHLQNKGHKKPLLTAYISSFNPDNDPSERMQEPWWMTFDRFIPEGAVFFLPATIPGWQNLVEPIPSRFYSAHFAFTLGKFCKEVPHDPEYYFHGEEISIAARAYTWGYDLFHPHKVVAWHEYTRKGRTKQWDDDPEWGQLNAISHKRNRVLFGMDGECMCQIDFGIYGFGKKRTLEDYERYAGLRFKDRSVQQYTLDNNIAPNPLIEDPVEYDQSFLSVFKHCIDIGFNQIPLDDYDVFAVAFEDINGNEIHRQDAMPDEIQRIKNDPDGYGKIWRVFNTQTKPVRWIVWPHSISQGWMERITGNLP